MESLPNSTQALQDHLFALQSDFLSGRTVRRWETYLRRFEEFSNDGWASAEVTAFTRYMLRMFGPADTAGIWDYHEAREQVHAHQQRHNISGLLIDTVGYATPLGMRWFSYPCHAAQLALQPEDLPILAAARWHVATYFRQVTVEMGYVLYEVLDGCLQKVELDVLSAMIEAATSAYIGYPYYRWLETSDGVYNVEPAKRFAPGRIPITLTLGSPDTDKTRTRQFVSKHPSLRFGSAITIDTNRLRLSDPGQPQ
ncbi:MAG: hypothetical protein EA367_00290 [Leptolyngbya sp. DLM2.Bin15]|nr:MAG: hypothetical protein EA367_00290 [Leptolyngbya sp. DLM2.Bin15]